MKLLYLSNFPDKLNQGFYLTFYLSLNKRLKFTFHYYCLCSKELNLYILKAEGRTITFLQRLRGTSATIFPQEQKTEVCY